LAMVLTKQTYNNQDKYKKPKDIHKKPPKLKLTKPNFINDSESVIAITPYSII